MDPDPDMQPSRSVALTELSGTIDMLWADCDLDTFWTTMPEELAPQWAHKLAA